MNRFSYMAVGVVGLASVAMAEPTITLIPQYVATRTSGGTIVAGFNETNLASGVGNDPTYRHRFNVLMRLDGAVAGEDFRAVTFNVSMGSGVTKATTNWTPASGTFQPDPDNDPDTTLNLFTNNADGATAADLQAIFVANTDPFAADSRQYGETPRPEFGSADSLGSPTRLGFFEVNWNGSGPTNLTFTFAGAAGSVFIGNGSGTGTPLTDGITTAANTFVFGSAIPEPTSLALIGLGGLALVRRRMA